MSEYQEFTGRTVEEAIKAARDSFGVSGLDDLDFEILTPGSRGVLGMGAEPARIIAAPRSALSGGTVRRDAAAVAPPPPAPPREEAPTDTAPRPPRSDSPGDAAPRSEPARSAPPPVQQAGANTSVPLRAPRPDQPPRDDRRGRDGGGSRDRVRRDDRKGSGLTQREAAEVASARASLTTEREEIQAAEASPEALAAGKDIVEQLVGLMGYRAKVSIGTGDTSKIDVSGVDDEEREALGALIGRKGERLSALQHLVNLMLSRRMGAWTRVLVDVEDYRGRRERQLGEIARRAADKVIESGTMLQLEPMPALERRWIHLALRDVAGVSTQSIGDEPMRRVVILRAAD
jgi:spoIIIJ-associated protein